MAKKGNVYGSKNDRLTIEENMTSFIKYRNHLMMLAMSMFQWDGLPDSINKRFLERTLYMKGACVFFKDDVLGYLCLPVMWAGPFDIYTDPKDYYAYSTNGYKSGLLNAENSVIIWNNYLRIPSCYTVDFDAKRLANLEQSIDVNCRAQKTPVAILCSENERLSMLNLYAKYDGNAPFIFGEKDLNVKGITAINTGAPFVADKLYQMKMQVWNEALTELGISNISYQKKERLVSDEVIRNMGGTIASRYTRLEMRRDAADKINELFGLDIKVSYRDDFRQTDDENMIGDDTTNSDNKPTAMVEDLRTR